MSLTDQSSEVLLKCEHVSKIFCSNLKKSLWYGAKDILRTTRMFPDKFSKVPLFLPEHRHLRPGEFWANKDISFELKRGECLGLIGRNGAGKTTLLKMLNGILKPDTGRITQKGKMGSLIALGAGFNPILSGRENIIANAMVLGLSNREIKDRIDEIIDFSDLREFIDAPVRNYSSGMQVRLGFSIATIINPDILILDEVLAVGDASFRHKCYSRINKLIKESAVILVSHSMDYIAQLATSVGVLKSGEMTLYHNVHEGIAAYNDMVSEDETTEESDGGKVTAFYSPIQSIGIRVPPVARYGKSLDVEIDIKSDENIDDCILSFALINRNEQVVMAFHTSNNQEKLRISTGRQMICLQIEPLCLHQGDYKWSLCMTRVGSIEHFVWYMRAGKITIERDGRPIGDIPYLPDATKIQVFPKR
jgi:lipopolysaccharide transport system ATP-binding protein